ncbi:MAG: hypothetical protein JXQ91_03240 [Vannielia sp.]|uniref:hypothetical protein n=1 Tax=Vannielia sp. TaxID=2813045 RepID=UPI003B8B5975
MIRALLLALAMPATPALALTCTPTTSCTLEGSCETGMTESRFTLTREGNTFALTDIPKVATAPEMRFTEGPPSGDGLRSFTLTSPERGEVALLTLHDERQFILSVHGQLFSTPFGFLSEGPCEGTL